MADREKERAAKNETGQNGASSGDLAVSGEIAVEANDIVEELDVDAGHGDEARAATPDGNPARGSAPMTGLQWFLVQCLGVFLVISTVAALRIATTDAPASERTARSGHAAQTAAPQPRGSEGEADEAAGQGEGSEDEADEGAGSDEADEAAGQDEGSEGKGDERSATAAAAEKPAKKSARKSPRTKAAAPASRRTAKRPRASGRARAGQKRRGRATAQSKGAPSAASPAKPAAVEPTPETDTAQKPPVVKAKGGVPKDITEALREGRYTSAYYLSSAFIKANGASAKVLLAQGLAACHLGKVQASERIHAQLGRAGKAKMERACREARIPIGGDSY